MVGKVMKGVRDWGGKRGGCEGRWWWVGEGVMVGLGV